MTQSSKTPVSETQAEKDSIPVLGECDITPTSKVAKTGE